MIGTLQDSICRKAANDILDEFQVGSPDEIDLHTLAWIGGRRLRIVESDLKGAEGRLIASAKGGTIRIRQSITSSGRKRFTIAHEIGHRVLHEVGSACDTVRDLRTWTKGSKETEANIFAGELLMPERLFKPLVSAQAPSLGFIDNLAASFRTSNLAAAVHFVMHTGEPCALVVSRNGTYEWSRKSPGFEFFISGGKIDSYTGVAEICAGKHNDTKGMDRSPAGAWLEGYDRDSNNDIMEDSRCIGEQNLIVTLLWVNEVLE